MAYKTVFKRYELKYLLTKEQKDLILAAMRPYMSLDDYGRSTIRNVYFDTDTYRLIRRSIERPSYKEKLRIRSYSKVSPSGTVFVELKKKYDHVVYKRRLALTEREAMNWVCGKNAVPRASQISNEIDYFLSYYGELHPSVFLSYEREAYFSRNGGDFRVTFDENILCRRDNISLTEDVYGVPILDPSLTLMEIKCAGGIPLWMAHTLSGAKIYKTSFSKYGTAYEKLILPDILNKTHKERKNTYGYI